MPDNPNVSEEEKGYARKLNAMKKIVYSRTLGRAQWNNSELHREISPEEIDKWRRQKGKDMLIYGSASIVQELADHGLIDEFQLLIHPVILGGGKSLFGNIREGQNLKLIDARQFCSGVVLMKYAAR